MICHTGTLAVSSRIRILTSAGDVLTSVTLITLAHNLIVIVMFNAFYMCSMPLRTMQIVLSLVFPGHPRIENSPATNCVENKIRTQPQYSKC